MPARKNTPTPAPAEDTDVVEATEVEPQGPPIDVAAALDASPDPDPEPPLDPVAATWAALARPFPGEQIEKLPKVLDRNDQRKGRCSEAVDGRLVSVDGHYCNGWHSPAVHLDYVGHAGITTRLNEVLGVAGWTFEPYSQTPEGLPLMARGEFYARLTITVPGAAPVTKWDLAANYNSSQEAYGDALRRCAMRFGVGTYLWSKSEAAATTAIAAHQQREAEREAAAEAERIAQGAQYNADRAAAWHGDVSALNASLDAAVTEGWAAHPVKLPDGTEVTFAEAIEHHRDRIAAENKPQEAASAPQAAQEAAPAPEAAQQATTPAEPAPATQAPAQAHDDARELAIEALNSDDVEFIRGIYKASTDLLGIDVRPVVTDDDLDVLGIPRETATAPLGGVLMQVGTYVDTHKVAIRHAHDPQPHPPAQSSAPAPADPWADQAAQGWPPVAEVP